MQEWKDVIDRNGTFVHMIEKSDDVFVCQPLELHFVDKQKWPPKANAKVKLISLQPHIAT